MTEFVTIKRIGPKIIILPVLPTQGGVIGDTVCVKVGEMELRGEQYHLLAPHPADEYPKEIGGLKCAPVPTFWARLK